MAEYIHRALNQQVTAIGGYYVLTQEVRLPFRGREVLYLLAHAAFDTSCCGAGGCAYALVPGFVVEWKSGIGVDRLAVSQVEPIHDPEMQREVGRLIQEREVVQQVVFL